MTHSTAGSFFIAILYYVLILPQLSQALEAYNGFDVENSIVPKNEIFSGGPPKDGIPAILKPKFESPKDSGWLKDDDLVTGVSINGETRAYPLRILVWHEAVNDTVGAQPILVSYCPLCGSTLVFSRNIDDDTFSFGISGLLYQSDVLFYDHKTESLWSQLEMKSIAGKMVGTRLEVLPSTLSTWREWKKAHPDTLVLSRDTGYSRDYSTMPYAGYEQSTATMFPVNHSSNRYHPKEKVLVVLVDGDAKAYPFSELKNAEAPLSDKIGNTDVKILFGDGDYVTATDSNGNPIESFVSYWFAWYTFRPETDVYKAK